MTNFFSYYFKLWTITWNCEPNQPYLLLRSYWILHFITTTKVNNRTGNFLFFLFLFLQVLDKCQRKAWKKTLVMAEKSPIWKSHLHFWDVSHILYLLTAFFFFKFSFLSHRKQGRPNYWWTSRMDIQLSCYTSWSLFFLLKLVFCYLHYIE